MQDSIEKEIELTVPPERVWRALTDARQFGQWFRVELDGPFKVGERVGGKLTIPGYEDYDWAVTVTAMEAEHLFSFTWHPHAVDPDRDYSDEPPTRVEFRLTPISSGTRLLIRESGFSALSDDVRRNKAFLENTKGWNMQARHLADHVERPIGE